MLLVSRQGRFCLSFIAHSQLFSQTCEYWYLPGGRGGCGGAVLIFQLFSKMTAFASCQVLITDHFKTLNLTKPDYFPVSEGPALCSCADNIDNMLQW